MSVAAEVRRTVAGLDRRAFLRARDLPGPQAAVESALSRLAAAGELTRVQQGLYYRPPGRGRQQPLPLEAGLAIAGSGAGPAGVSAARMFGLTTQVPGIDLVAAPGRAPQDRDGVRFISRPIFRRELGLNPHEAGLLEVLHDFDKVAEEPFEQLVGIVERAIDSGTIRPGTVRSAAAEEWDVATRDRWQRIETRVRQPAHVCSGGGGRIPTR